MDMIGYLMGDNGTCDWLPWKMAQFVRWITWYILVYLQILVIFHGYVRLPVGMSGYVSLGYNLGCRKWDEIRIPWRFYRDTMEVWHDITVLYDVFLAYLAGRQTGDSNDPFYWDLILYIMVYYYGGMMTEWWISSIHHLSTNFCHMSFPLGFSYRPNT